jgi:hypothetical protein
MKSNDLIGEGLDLWVVQAIKASRTPKLVELLDRCARAHVPFQPSTISAQADYVIAHGGLECRRIEDGWWGYASILGGTVQAPGPTFEVAAMRAFVKAHLGDTVPAEGP